MKTQFLLTKGNLVLVTTTSKSTILACLIGFATLGNKPDQLLIDISDDSKTLIRHEGIIPSVDQTPVDQENWINTQIGLAMRRVITVEE